MADNIFVRPATEFNRLKVATDEVGSQDSAVHYPVYKQSYGPAGVTPTPVTESTPLPAESYTVRSDDLLPLGADGTKVPLQTDEDGALWVHEKHNKIDAGNSTATPLAADAVYTGTWVDLLSYAAVSITLQASHSSATDGMLFQYSTDGTNVDKSFTFEFTAGNGGRVFQLPLHAQYFRVKYTNGSTLQTSFRLQTVLLHNTPVQTTHRLIDDVNPDRSGTLVKAALIAQKAGTGDLSLVQATTGGNLKLSLEEFDDTFLTNPLPVVPQLFSEVEYLSTYLLDTAAIDMAVDGTTPVTYKYTVPAGKILYIKRGFLVVEDGAVAFVPGDFGALGAALTNGVSVGVTPNGGGRVEIENWKANRQIRDTMFDFDTEFRVDGAYVGRWSFTRDLNDGGMVLTAGDIFDFKIQDNLTGLDYMSFKIKGILKAV